MKYELKDLKYKLKQKIYFINVFKEFTELTNIAEI